MWWGGGPHLLMQLLLRGVQVHLPLLLVSIGAMLLALFGQSFLSHLPLVLPPLGQMLQQLRLLTLQSQTEGFVSTREFKFYGVIQNQSFFLSN